MSKILFKWSRLLTRNQALFGGASSGKRHASDCSPSKTCLYDFHVKNGGKMVNFAGYLMPLQYGSVGIAESHRHTREHCSLFDVSHMLQQVVTGKHAADFLESLTVGDLKELQIGEGTLSLFTNCRGGIIDDLICNRIGDESFYVVSNAGRRDSDLKLMNQQLEEFKKDSKDVNIEQLDSSFGLVALQGPESSQVMQALVEIDMTSLKFMRTTECTVAGIQNCRVTRCGYTGEDGVEISVPLRNTQALAETLLTTSKGSVRLAGLGARDTLRIEAGLCLYGSDINEGTTPVEASLAWTIGKRRRKALDFPGAEAISAHLNKQGLMRRRVGLITQTGRPFRAGAEIIVDGQIVGRVTSGCPSPTLGYNIGMGYVQPQFVKSGTKINVRVRKDEFPGHIAKMPFVTAKYFQ